MGSVSNLKCFSGEDFLFDGLPTEVSDLCVREKKSLVLLVCFLFGMFLISKKTENITDSA